MLARAVPTSVFAILAALFATAAAAVAAVPDGDEVRAAIRQRVENLSPAAYLEIKGARVAAMRFVPALYAERGFRPLWSGEAPIDALFDGIARSGEHGLDPADFHDRELRELRQWLAGGTAKASDFADLDILLTDSLARLGHQLFWGKVDPEQLDAAWNFQRPLLGADPVALVERSFETGKVDALLRGLELDHPAYLRLKAGLARYRALQAAGGWPGVPEGPALKPGMREPRVPALRRRLAAEGLAAGAPPADPHVYDPALAAAVDTASLDWANVSARGFPYQIVQQPGPENALGLVKFMFPNKHLVYLHDTPARDLFERSERAFSSGCVRLKDPFDLAELLLADLEGWDRQKIDAAVRSGETQRVELAKTMPVLLLYWTVNINDDGSVSFKSDVYERDGPLLAALDGEFQPKEDPEAGQQ